MKRASFKRSTAAAVQVQPQFTPTDEQVEAVRLFNTRGSLAVEAGAGTGKTSLLHLMAESARSRKGQYTVFNKALASEAESKFAGLCSVNTIHSLAWGAVGHKYGDRMPRQGSSAGNRVKPSELAKTLRLTGISIYTPFSHYAKLIAPWQQAGYIRNMVVNYCQSGDRDLTLSHFPSVEGIDPATGPRPNHHILAQALLPAARILWADISNPRGKHPVDYAHFLKVWELAKPKIKADYLLIDECQDLSPVMLSIIQQQTQTQVIWCGDPAQMIYDGWAGAVNAFDHVTVDATTQLSKSWRFGSNIAAVANRLLDKLIGYKLRLTGNGTTGRVGPIAHPKAMLCRTNAAAVEGVLSTPNSHLIGGGDEVIRFVEAVQELRAGRKAFHHDLACFDTYEELEAYITDGGGDDLKLLVGLEKKFGGRAIAGGLRNMPTRYGADIIYSTAHKVKGLQFDTVKLAPDFAFTTQRCECGHSVSAHREQAGDEVCLGCRTKGGAQCPTYRQKPVSQSEYRLLYVTCTRAQSELDHTAVTI